MYLGSESVERSESEVLLKGVSSEGTETGPVGTEQGYVSTAPASEF